MRSENSFPSFTKPKQGSNFHGPPIQVHELHERELYERVLKIRLKRIAKFTAFIFATIIQSGALIDNVPIIYTDVLDLKPTLSELDHTFIDIYDEVTILEHFTSAAVVEGSKLVKSSEWERLLVVQGPNYTSLRQKCFGIQC